MNYKIRSAKLSDAKELIHLFEQHAHYEECKFEYEEKEYRLKKILQSESGFNCLVKKSLKEL